MKRLALVLLFLIISHSLVLADVRVFAENNKFGLQDKSGNVIVKPKYKKLVRLGETAWIMQDGSRFGIINDDGKVIEPAKYVQAERVLGKFVKFKKGEKYGIFDEMGFEILPVEYSSIDLLYGGVFVTCKNYKYGVTDFNGQLVLDNIFDDIYTEGYDKLILVYAGQIYSVERESNKSYDALSVHEQVDLPSLEEEFNLVAATGYYSVTLTDYILKLFSSISPAYEKTIDELMYSQGADTVNVLMRFSWLPKFPFVYAKKYYHTYIDPTNGPLSKVKTSLKNKD